MTAPPAEVADRLAAVDGARDGGRPMTVADRLAALADAESLAIWVDAVRTELLAALVHEEEGAPKVVAEVAFILGVAEATVRLRAAVARELTGRLPPSMDAMRRGELRWSHARGLADATAVLPDELATEVERRVLPAAPGTSVSAFTRLVTRAVLDVDPPAAEAAHEYGFSTRRVRVSSEPDGMAALWALLPAEGAAVVARGLRDLASAAPGQAADDRTLDQREADALVQVFTDLAGAAPGTRPRRRGGTRGRAAVSVTVSAETLLGLDDAPAALGAGRLSGPITAAQARRIAADGIWRRLLTDPVSGALLTWAESATGHPPSCARSSSPGTPDAPGRAATSPRWVAISTTRWTGSAAVPPARPTCTARAAGVTASRPSGGGSSAAPTGPPPGRPRAASPGSPRNTTCARRTATDGPGEASTAASGSHWSRGRRPGSSTRTSRRCSRSRARLGNRPSHLRRTPTTRRRSDGRLTSRRGREQTPARFLRWGGDPAPRRPGRLPARRGSGDRLVGSRRPRGGRLLPRPHRGGRGDRPPPAAVRRGDRDARTPLPATVLDRLPRLRLLVTTGMGNAAVDVAAATRNGVTVCGTGMAGSATPELTWALILATTRRLAAQDGAIRVGGWQHDIGPELAGSTLGLLGLGRIGRRLARYAAAFDMPVIAWSANLTDQAARQADATRVGFDELFTGADVLAVTTRLSDRTRAIVGARELDLLGPAGYLVNTSRGPIVDEAALVTALHQRRIAGAGLDVYDTEPLPPGHPLRTAPNTVLTPHLGYVSTQAYAVLYGEAVEDVTAWLDGSPLRTLTR